MKTRYRVLMLWIAACICAAVSGLHFGVGPGTTMALFAGSIVPPVLAHIVACSRVMRQTRAVHPDAWLEVKGATKIRSFLFDGIDFGDSVILQAKADLKFWMFATLAGIGFYIFMLHRLATIAVG